MRGYFQEPKNIDRTYEDSHESKRFQVWRMRLQIHASRKLEPTRPSGSCRTSHHMSSLSCRLQLQVDLGRPQEGCSQWGQERVWMLSVRGSVCCQSLPFKTHGKLTFPNRIWCRNCHSDKVRNGLINKQVLRKLYTVTIKLNWTFRDSIFIS